MRKVFIAALVLMSLDAYIVAIAKAAGKSDKCEAILISCNDKCAAELDSKRNCFNLCFAGYDLCRNFTSGPKGDDRTTKNNGGAANTKNIPPSGSVTNAGGNAGTAATTLGTSGSAPTPTKPASAPSLGGGSPASVSGGSGLTNRKLQ